MHLRPIEHQKQRILTTQQIAEAYGADAKIVLRNFNRNKDRYTEGKHYFLLEGDVLKQFKTNYLQETSSQFDVSSEETTTQNEDSLKGVNKLYLWTEKGALMHAKSLNTDKAWESYEFLVDDYYRRGDQIQNLQAVLALGQTVRTEFARIDTRMDDLYEKTRALHLDDTDRAIIPVNIYRLSHAITDLQDLAKKTRLQPGEAQEIRAHLSTLTRMMGEIKEALTHESERHEQMLDTYQLAQDTLEAIGEMMPGDTPKLLKEREEHPDE